MFTDGSASPYANITDAQKSAAVAVIFDATNQLGVGLDTASQKAWCANNVNGYDTTQNATSENDGNANTNQIKNLTDYNETNYPAFYFCTSYSKTGFASGWYLPAKNELQKIFDNRNTVNAAFTALGKGSPFSTGWWWSSSQKTSYGPSAYEFRFSDGACDTCGKSGQFNCVCAVRAFN